MFRYVAFVWNDAEAPAREAAQALIGRLQAAGQEWQPALKRGGIAVFYTGARPGSGEVYPLGEGSGVVLGKLFTRARDGHSVSAPLHIDARESEKIATTAGRHLVERYWGRYVAFLHEPASQTSYVLHDPTGVLPCQTMRSNGVEVFFSSMEDAARLASNAMAIDWSYVAAALCFMRLQTHATGLQGISQVLGGECVSIRRGEISRMFYWNPLRIADTEAFENPKEAAEALRWAALDCVQAWASCYEGIMHTLSGGLDSSIVMACLQEMPTPPRITCVNYHSPDADGDERHFARRAARRAGRELIERERIADVRFEPLLEMEKLSVPPVTVLYYLENIRPEARLAAEQGATAVFSGNTGDQLFYQNSAGFGVADYVARHGLRPALFGVALDAARMDRRSVWAVLRDALSQELRGERWSPSEHAGEFRYLLSADAMTASAAEERFIHPLFRSPERAPSGKRYHAYSLLFPPDIHSPLSLPGDPDLVAPLYSQPLIEVLLRTPVYLLTHGGWDRATARRAFQHDVPREIITRQTKGGMEEHAKAIFLRNIALVRELLSDGFLVRENIVDKKKLHEVLSGGPTRLSAGTVELFDYFAAEAWARRWCGATSQRVAA